MALTTKPRWDKYDPYVANFRAPLAAEVVLATQANKVIACGINSSGAVTFGSGQTGIKGVTIIPVGVDMHGDLLDGGVNIEAGDITDVGKHGEVTNFYPYAASGTAPAPTAGTNYYGHADGSVLPSTAAGAVYVGHTVEADRLIVEVADGGPLGRVLDNVPVGLAGVGGTAQVVLTWTPVRNATGYKVQKSTDNSTFSAAGTPTATTQTVTTLTAGSANYFRVLATVGGVDSSYSTSVQVTVL
jgi:hypothetical protein